MGNKDKGGRNTKKAATRSLKQKRAEKKAKREALKGKPKSGPFLFFGSSVAVSITATLDAGVPLRDVQEAASHADPRTTMRYDRARRSLDRHATYIIATFVAGASR